MQFRNIVFIVFGFISNKVTDTVPNCPTSLSLCLAWRPYRGFLRYEWGRKGLY